MTDHDKTKAQLIAELAELRQRVVALDAQAARSQQAEEALRQSDQRFYLHFERTPLGAIEWDLEFRVTRWNPGAERIFGHSREEALGRHASFVVPASVREHVDRIWNGLLARKSGERSTNENVTKDGQTILCEWYNTSLVDADGHVIGVASLVDDITDRIRAKEVLQKAHDQLEDKVRERTAELAIFQRFSTTVTAPRPKTSPGAVRPKRWPPRRTTQRPPPPGNRGSLAGNPREAPTPRPAAGGRRSRG